MSMGKSVLVLAAVCCVVSSNARADDTVYSGTSTVESAGRNPAACVAHPVKMIVADGHVPFGVGGGAPLAAGPVAPDGTFSLKFTRSLGRNGVIAVENTVSGRIQDGKLIGGLSNTSGCIENWTLTKR